MSVKPVTSILVYPCTLVGYVRLTLLGGMWQLLSSDFADKPWFRLTFVTVVGVSLLLDVLDGHLARKFNHTSTFGAFFDLLLDLMTHTLIWTVSGLTIAPLLIGLEWTGGLFIAVFAMQPDIEWKTSVVRTGKGLLKRYFDNNQRNVLSAYGNICHFIFPTALYLGIFEGWVYALSLPGVILYETTTVYLIIALNKALTESRKARQSQGKRQP